MKLYVANLTKMVHDFTYVVPETGRQMRQKIEIGQQVMIYRPDATPEVLMAIVAQHEMYGLVAADSVDRSRVFVGLCYSFDKPVSEATMIRGINANERQLEILGERLRQESAVAAHSIFARPETAQGGALKHVTIEVKEQESRNRGMTGPLFEEKVQVAREGYDPAATPAPARGRNKGRGGSRISV